jgi:2-dehydropantoate 2-reductase
MRYLIYGAGAVGLGLASFITKTGQPVDIIARQDTAAALREGGLVRTGLFGSHVTLPELLGAFSRIEDVAETPYSHVIFCTKTYDLAEAAKNVASRRDLLERILDGRLSVVLTQNGWGNAETCSTFFPDQRIFNARVITGFIKTAPNHVDITVHADAVTMGSLFGAHTDCLETLCRAIREGGLPCRLTGEIERDLWAKMLYNCALNPLGAIFGVPYGVLGEWDHTRHVMEGIVHEIFAVMEGAGYHTHWKRPGDYLKIFYEKLLPATAEHESSTLQDIRRQGRTEIDALNGAVVRLGEGLGVAVPVNAVVYRMLRFLEERNVGLKPSY